MKFFKAENTKKRLVITKLLNTIIWEIWNLHWLKIQTVKNGLWVETDLHLFKKIGFYQSIFPIISTTFLPSSVRRYSRPLWASSLMQTIRLCSFKSVSTLLTCFIPTPDYSLIFVGILTSFFKVSSTFRL